MCKVKDVSFTMLIYRHWQHGICQSTVICSCIQTMQLFYQTFLSKPFPKIKVYFALCTYLSFIYQHFIPVNTHKAIVTFYLLQQSTQEPRSGLIRLFIVERPQYSLGMTLFFFFAKKMNFKSDYKMNIFFGIM